MTDNQEVKSLQGQYNTWLSRPVKRRFEKEDIIIEISEQYYRSDIMLIKDLMEQLTTTQQRLDNAVEALNVLAQTNRLGGVKMGSVAGFKETRLEYTKRIAKAALASMEK